MSRRVTTVGSDIINLFMNGNLDWDSSAAAAAAVAAAVAAVATGIPLHLFRSFSIIIIFFCSHLFLFGALWGKEARSEGSKNLLHKSQHCEINLALGITQTHFFLIAVFLLTQNYIFHSETRTRFLGETWDGFK